MGILIGTDHPHGWGQHGAEEVGVTHVPHDWTHPEHLSGEKRAGPGMWDIVIF